MKFLTCICFSILALNAPNAQSDVISTGDGEVTITPIVHGTLVMEWQAMTIYVDPYGGAELFSKFEAPSLVLITHAHGDHLNKQTLSGLDLSNAELIAPQSVVDSLGKNSFNNVTALENGNELNRNGVKIEAIPMYNLPDDETSRHPKGWGNGYVVTIGDTRFYFSGDTEDIPEMRNLKAIDYAFVCMNLPYTMTVEQAADAVLDFQPDVVYPYHYRGKDGLSDVYKFKSLVNAGDKDIEVRLRDWYPGR